MSPVLYRAHSFLVKLYSVVLVISDISPELLLEVIHAIEGLRYWNKLFCEKKLDTTLYNASG